TPRGSGHGWFESASVSRWIMDAPRAAANCEKPRGRPTCRSRPRRTSPRRPQKGKIVGQHVQQIDSWDQVKRIFEKQVDTSLLIIPVGLRLLRLGSEEQKGE